METKIVTIEKVGKGWVDYRDPKGISWTMVSKKFAIAKVGQKWQITIETGGQFPTGELIDARLVQP